MIYCYSSAVKKALLGYLSGNFADNNQGGLTLNKKSTRRYKAFYKVSRVVHIYISMVLLTLLAFFCLTGIFLNHNEWFTNNYTEQSVLIDVNGPLHAAIAETLSLADAPTQEIQTLLAKRYNLSTLNQMNFDSESGELVFDYQLPAGYATAYFSREGDATLEYRKGSIITILNDLHKGRHSGPVWSWLIDISAVFMLVFSVAGLVILIQNKKYRKAGLVLGAFGFALPLVIYFLWVPFIAGV
ncbi:hypothetical protein SAMN02745866_02574 [Alteromonadaceae bacterium Bs31]|nr:hypothetical protein SAMN02745866_02574 [Alteromonadaceae bacterium Bs31]